MHNFVVVGMNFGKWIERCGEKKVESKTEKWYRGANKNKDLFKYSVVWHT